MPILIRDVLQGSPEWHEFRTGIPTASGFNKIVTSTGEPSTQAAAYMRKLAVERITGKNIDSYQSRAMAEGKLREEKSRKFYEMITDNTVDQVAICYKDEAKRFACSPDGLIGDDGGFEVKNPEAHTHVKYLVEDKLPTAYIPQVQGSLYVTERDWWDFMSHYEGIKPFIIRVYPDLVFHEKLAAALNEFCDDLDRLVAVLTEEVETKKEVEPAVIQPIQIPEPGRLPRLVEDWKERADKMTTRRSLDQFRFENKDRIMAVMPHAKDQEEVFEYMQQLYDSLGGSKLEL